MALQFPVGGFALAAPASWLAAASAVLLGGMNSSYVTLGMYAEACSDKAALTRNMRLVSLIFTASSIVGPLAAGFAMKARGSDMLL
ncbi:MULTISPECIES: hypothetical protein [Paraburkholderia]|uniref:hypothetical protein n=1 Tax=Paraburkholderia TaxID=1822464 RepID=UPI001FE4DB3B|nr:hypothetical protein [Paraburkholderia podalyriae]